MLWNLFSTCTIVSISAEFWFTNAPKWFPRTFYSWQLHCWRGGYFENTRQCPKLNKQSISIIVIKYSSEKGMKTWLTISKPQGALKEKKPCNPSPYGGWLKLSLTTEDRAIICTYFKPCRVRQSLSKRVCKQKAPFLSRIASFISFRGVLEEKGIRMELSA